MIYYGLHESMDKKAYFSSFNRTYFELLKMMKEQVQDNKDFKRFYNQNLFVKRTNIKLLIRTWYEHITYFYKEPIFRGNIQFFLDKDYSSDISENRDFSNTYSIDTYIQYFKSVYESLDKKQVDTFVSKVQELTQLSNLYYS